MRRLLAVAVLGALALAGPAASTAAGSFDTGIEGRVLDETCYGPCVNGEEPRPFTGEAEVVVLRARSGREVARVTVAKSRFGVRLGRGRYRVRVQPYPDEPEPRCWEGSERRARVRPGEITRVRLTVVNVCIL